MPCNFEADGGTGDDTVLLPLAELNADASDGYAKFALTEMTQGDTPEELRVCYAWIHSTDAAEGFWGSRYTMSGDEKIPAGCDGLRQREIFAGVQWRMGGGDDHEREWRQLLMAEFLTFDTDLTAVANAIRAKGGTSAQLIYPSGFVSAIQAIQNRYYAEGSSYNDTRGCDHSDACRRFQGGKGNRRC